MDSFIRHGTTWNDEAQGGIPARFRRIKERVAGRDRDWFAAHPDERRYVRPYVPGELWPGLPPEGLDVVVLVTQVEPGFRFRVPIHHLVKRPGQLMVIIDPTSGCLLCDVPMEGVDP